jgi:alpha-L-fucosidase 2
MTSPWSGNYQININIQLIYMPCGVLGLSECQEPFVEWLRGMVTPGREVARAYYGTEGWMQHTTGNIWGYASPGSSLDWGIFPSGAAWNCRHVWEQYEFTQERTDLREKAYPLMKEAAQFYLANMVEYRGHLLPAPAISAEHQSSLGYLEPPFQDVEMVGDLFANVVEAAKVLDVDAEFRQRVAATRERMMPLKIGRLGQCSRYRRSPLQASPFHAPVRGSSGPADRSAAHAGAGRGGARLDEPARRRRKRAALRPEVQPRYLGVFLPA